MTKAKFREGDILKSNDDHFWVVKLDKGSLRAFWHLDKSIHVDLNLYDFELVINENKLIK